MSEIVSKFNDFLKAHDQRSYKDLVDLSSLANECSVLTPTVRLKLSEASNDSGMAAVIVENMIKFSPNRKFPLISLRAVGNLISKSVNIEEVRLQQMLLIHLTKMDLDVNTFTHMVFRYFNTMTTDINVDSRFEDWKTIADRVLHHRHVRDVIEETILEIFGSDHREKVFNTKDMPVAVSFFSSEMVNLRGFVGFNMIYVNWDHFDTNFHKSGQNKSLVLTDIATVVIHELAHLRVRQVFDEMNFSTPTKITANGCDDPEFGRLIERKIFGETIDWLASFPTIPSTYIDSFVQCILNDEDLPAVPAEAILLKRLSITTFFGGAGADLSVIGITQ